jgi:hypothetical protein
MNVVLFMKQPLTVETYSVTDIKKIEISTLESYLLEPRQLLPKLRGLIQFS